MQRKCIQFYIYLYSLPMVVGYFKMSRIIDKLSFLILLKLWDPAPSTIFHLETPFKFRWAWNVVLPFKTFWDVLLLKYIFLQWKSMGGWRHLGKSSSISTRAKCTRVESCEINKFAPQVFLANYLPLNASLHWLCMDSHHPFFFGVNAPYACT